VKDALKAQRRPATKKTSTVAIERIQIFKEHELTIGLDLRDRTSHCGILKEAGEVILESKVSTTPNGISEYRSQKTADRRMATRARTNGKESREVKTKPS
jgi:hypothetical protein